MSIKELQDEVKTLKSMLEENLILIKEVKELLSNDNNMIEAVAAKIIKELKILILENSDAEKQKELPLKSEERPTSSGKYSYPNYGVGNGELGSSKNPKALTWPFGKSDSN